MYNKEERKTLAQDTLGILKSGEYNSNGEIIKLDNKIKTEFYIQEQLENIVSDVRYDNPVIEIKNENVIDTIHNLYKEYGSDVCVLNFASGYMPCGGWLNGSLAQEEAIAYCSNLYSQQTSKIGWQFYKANRDSNSLAYLNNMLLSDVLVFRDSDYNLLSTPSKVKIITAPAVHLNRVKKQKEKLPDNPNKIMEFRMRLILNLMLESKCSHVVLGAFGCGAYGNDVYSIIDIWNKLLHQEDYKCKFKSITFSVLENRRDDNYNVFKQRLRLK